MERLLCCFLKHVLAALLEQLVSSAAQLASDLGICKEGVCYAGAMDGHRKSLALLLELKNLKQAIPFFSIILQKQS